MSDFLLQNPAVLVLASTILMAILLYLRQYNKGLTVELKENKLLAEFRQKELDMVSALEEQSSKQVLELLNKSQAIITTSSDQFLQYMSDLQKSSSSFEQSSNKMFEERINRMFASLEQRLSNFLISSEQKTTQSIELELKGARNLIESYKEQQLKLIDENIIAMMEQTLNIVLAKKLSLKDQLELVYEALEKAKVEKFIV